MIRHLLVCLIGSFVYSGSFTINPTQIAAGTYTSGVYNNVYSCYNSINNQIVFSWDDTSRYGNPWYAIYDVRSSSFTTSPTQIAAGTYTSGVLHDVYSCYNSINNQIVFSWSGYPVHNPWYAIYDVRSGAFTTSPTQIAAGTYTSGVLNDVYSCYNSINNQIVFSWSGYPVQNPWYAIYDVRSGAFTTSPTQIAAGTYTSGVRMDVCPCYNSINNQIVFNWSGYPVQNPWYAIYDVRSSAFITSPTQIAADTYTSGVLNNVYSCYNSTNNQIVFSWTDLIIGQQYPWYSIYTQVFPMGVLQRRLIDQINSCSPLKTLKGIQ